MIYDLVIVGAGPCGLSAAINSTLKKIIVFDKKSGAKKLSLTGRNRSNITNCIKKEEFIAHYGKTGNFLRDAFNVFFKDDLIKFLNTINIETKCEDNRVLLKNISSEKFADALIKEAHKKNIELRTNEAITDIHKHKGLFYVTSQKSRYKSKAVILACGGRSYPQTGSDGTCYKIAQSLDHTIIEPQPYEVPFCSKDAAGLQGISFKDVSLSLKIKKKRIEESGDIIFTHFGISGPAILRLSEYDFDEAKLSIRFVDIDKSRFIDDMMLFNGKVKNYIKKYMPERFINAYLDLDKKTRELSKSEINNILKKLYGFELTVKKCSFDRAFVTKGGVDTRKINPKTMESRITDNLYFCGEMMDIQGSIGGFNLQAAFSTGFLSASAINSRIKY